VSHISIGPIHKKDVMRANIMNEKKIPEFATILAFDVSIDADAQVRCVA
jgi:translation initiation factor 5B